MTPVSLPPLPTQVVPTPRSQRDDGGEDDDGEEEQAPPTPVPVVVSTWCLSWFQCARVC
jgi:hypothetical protein